MPFHTSDADYPFNFNCIQCVPRDRRTSRNRCVLRDDVHVFRCPPPAIHQRQQGEADDVTDFSHGPQNVRHLGTHWPTSARILFFVVSRRASPSQAVAELVDVARVDDVFASLFESYFVKLADDVRSRHWSAVELYSNAALIYIALSLGQKSFTFTEFMAPVLVLNYYFCSSVCRLSWPVSFRKSDDLRFVRLRVIHRFSLQFTTASSKIGSRFVTGLVLSV